MKSSKILLICIFALSVTRWAPKVGATDLTVTDVTIIDNSSGEPIGDTIPVGTVYNFKPTIKNVGQTNIDLSGVTYAVAQDGGINALGPCKSPAVVLEPGEEIVCDVVNLGGFGNSPGWHTLAIMADYGDVIDEDNEDNNVYETTFLIGELSTDLTVTDVTIIDNSSGEPIGDTIPVGTVYNFKPTIKNVGQTNIDLSGVTYAVAQDGGINALGPCKSPAVVLEPGEEIVCDVVNLGGFGNSPGWHTLAIMADYGDVIDEDNEDNNVYETTFFIGEPGQIETVTVLPMDRTTVRRCSIQTRPTLMVTILVMRVKGFPAWAT